MKIVYKDLHITMQKNVAAELRSGKDTITETHIKLLEENPMVGIDVKAKKGKKEKVEEKIEEKVEEKKEEKKPKKKK